MIAINDSVYNTWRLFITEHCAGAPHRNDDEIVWCEDCRYFSGGKCKNIYHPSIRADGPRYDSLVTRR